MNRAGSHLRARLRAAWLGGVVLSLGCASAPVPAPRDPVLSTRSVRPSRSPSGPDRAAYVAGDTEARQALSALLVALRDEDADGLERLFAPAVAQNTPPPGVRRVVLPLVQRSVLVQRLLAARRVSRFPIDAPLDALLVVDSIETVPARVYFGEAPISGIDPADVIVRFRVPPDAERALLGLATRGEGRIVVRPSPAGARIVGL